MMKKKTMIQRERKARMGIVTNKMSDEVYAILDQKASKNELSTFIIGLVEKEINGEFLQEQFSFTKMNLEELNETLTKMTFKLLELTKEK